MCELSHIHVYMCVWGGGYVRVTNCRVIHVLYCNTARVPELYQRLIANQLRLKSSLYTSIGMI